MPLIFWSSLVVLASLPMIVFFDYFIVNVSFVATFACIFYYILLEPLAGVLH